MRKLVLILLVMLGGATYSMADTLTLEGVGAGNIGDNGQAYTFPYLFSIDGGLTLTPLMCDDFTDEIWIGESWTVTANNFTAMMGGVGSSYTGAGQMNAANGVAGITGNYNAITNPNGMNATQRAYAIEAYIYANSGLVNGASETDIAANEAVWELFAPTPGFSDQSNVNSILSNAEAMTASLTVASAEAEFQNLIFYVPLCNPVGSSNCNQNPASDASRPQEFIGMVPEPTTLLLFGTGLALTFMVRRRKSVVSTN